MGSQFRLKTLVSSQNLAELLENGAALRQGLQPLRERGVRGKSGLLVQNLLLSRVRETRGTSEKSHTVELVVVQHQRPSRFGVEAEAEGMLVRYDYDFSAAAGGTDVTLTCTVNASGLKTLLAPLAAMAMKRHDGNVLIQLDAAMARD